MWAVVENEHDSSLSKISLEKSVTNPSRSEGLSEMLKASPFWITVHVLPTHHLYCAKFRSNVAMHAASSHLIRVSCRWHLSLFYRDLPELVHFMKECMVHLCLIWRIFSGEKKAKCCMANHVFGAWGAPRCLPVVSLLDMRVVFQDSCILLARRWVGPTCLRDSAVDSSERGKVISNCHLPHQAAFMLISYTKKFLTSN